MYVYVSISNKTLSGLKPMMIVPENSSGDKTNNGEKRRKEKANQRFNESGDGDESRATAL